MSASFHIIDKSTWERTIYFDYYYSQIKCKYNLNVNIDITHLVSEQKRRGIRFFPTMLYVIMKAVNQNKEFRMSFRSCFEFLQKVFLGLMYSFSCVLWAIGGSFCSSSENSLFSS